MGLNAAFVSGRDFAVRPVLSAIVTFSPPTKCSGDLPGPLS